MMGSKQKSASNLYRSYLLRLWRTEADNGTVWRASLETIGSGERHGFARMESLYAFLDAEVQANSSTPPPPGSRED